MMVIAQPAQHRADAETPPTRCGTRAGRDGRRRPGTPRDHDSRQREGARVDAQRPLRVQQRDDRTAQREAGDLGELVGHHPQAGGHPEPLGVERDGDEADLGSREGRPEQHSHGEQHEQRHGRQAREGHDQEQRGTGEVDAHHDRALGEAVDETGQQRPAGKGGQERQGICDGGLGCRVGPLEDQDREGDTGELIAEDGLRLRHVERAKQP